MRMSSATPTLCRAGRRDVAAMAAGAVEAERGEPFRRDLRRVDLGEPRVPDTARAQPCEQLRQARAVVLDQRAQRHDLAVIEVEQVRLDALVGGDGEPG